MQVYLGPGTFAGERYTPDEVAKAIVGEMKLEKGACISKQTIQDYLSRIGIGLGLTTDVAMVLRNMYGLTPTFAEDKSMSSDLIAELSGVLTEDYDRAAPKKVPAADLTEEQAVRLYENMIQEEFNAATDPLDEAVIAQLSLMPIAVVEDIALLDSVLNDDHFAQIECCLSIGGSSLVEAWFEAFTRPHRVRFMSEETKGQLLQVVEAMSPLAMAGQASRRAAGAARSRMNPAAPRDDDELIQALARRGQGSVGDSARMLMRRQQAQMPAAQADHDPGPVPTLGARVKQGARAAMAGAGRAAQAVGRGVAAAPGQAAAGLGRAAQAAGHGLAAGAGSLAGTATGAYQRARTQMAQGRPAAAAAPAPGEAPQGSSHDPSAQMVRAEPEAGAAEPAQRKPGMFQRFVRGAGRLAGRAALAVGRGMRNAGANVGAAALHHLRNRAPILAAPFGLEPGEREQRYGNALHQRDMKRAQVAQHGLQGRPALAGGSGQGQRQNQGQGQGQGQGQQRPFKRRQQWRG